MTAQVAQAERPCNHAVWISIWLVYVVIAFIVIWKMPSGYFPWGIVAASFWLLLGIWPPCATHFFPLIVGKDGNWSTSKFQVYLWTGAIAFCIATIISATRKVPEIPPWVWVALGLSGSTALGAKGITVGYIEHKRLQPSTGADATSGALGLIADDDNSPNLPKMQMLFWTIFSIFFVMWECVCSITATPTPAATQMPDLPASFLVLAGLGQGIYLGNKLFDSEQPRITGLGASAVAPGNTVTVTGANFGTDSTELQVALDGATVISPLAANFSDTSFQFIVPTAPTGATAWPPGGKTVTIKVTVRQVPSVNTTQLTIKP